MTLPLRALAAVGVLALTPAALGDAPTRGPDAEPHTARRGAEAAPSPTPAQRTARQTTRELEIDVPIQCGGTDMKSLRAELASMESPDDLFYVELWSDKQTYHVHDEVFYYVRTNRNAYATLFWMGPDDSVFMPFTNVPLEADRTHRLDPDNIIVEPTGREAWRLVVTIEPQRFPCTSDEPALQQELDRVRAGFHAVARWEVTSTR